MSESQPAGAIEAIEALLARWTRVWHEGALEEVEDCVAPAYIRHDRQGDRVVTPAQYSREIAAWRDSMPDLRFTNQDQVIAPPLVLVRGTMTGTRNGRPYSLAGLQVYKVEDGKLAETWAASRGDDSRWPDSPA